MPDNNGRYLLAIGGGSAISVSGSGSLATIKFEAVGAGVSIIDIPQNDFDGDGSTDEGVVLTQNGGLKIGDVNSDSFFDGPVQSARIAVGTSCGAPTEEPTDPPTPAPATPSASSGATATPSTPTQSSGPTTTDDPPATAVETATTPASTPGQGNAVWGDNNCSGEANPVDSLITLRFDAGLGADTGECPDMGQIVEVQNASPHPWGDVDCGGDVTPVDSLKLLRHDAGLSVARVDGCPEIGTSVTIVEG